MYEQVFNLTSRPFTSTHYVKHYFAAKAIEDSLQQSLMLIDRGSGPVVVVGDHGTGKTLLLAILEESFKSSLKVVNVSASLIRKREDLWQNILFQLQMNYRGLGENEMRMDLIEMLKNEESQSVLLMIDDAQKLTAESIEEIQMLTDYVQEDKPRVRLLLAGSQGLEERLADTRLVSFNQRIAGRFFLSCLSRDEVEAYVRTHVERADGDPEKLFSPDSYRAIHEVSEGRPRYINQVCDHAMIFSATRGTTPITDSLVREAWYDIQKLPGSVAPAGSGAAASDSPVATQNVQTDDEGWTVLEFGELSDTEAESVKEPEAAEQPATPQKIEIPAAPGLIDSAAPTEEQIDGAQVEETPDAGAQEEETQSESPTTVGGAALLASALAGYGASKVSLGPKEKPEAEASQESEPEQTEEPETQPQPEEPVAEKEQTESETSTAVFDDPFASDEFENEEVLTDAYSPFVAQQNQRSLDVTSEQLQNLTPGDSVEWNESTKSVEQEEESFPTFESAMAPPEPVREAVKPEREMRELLDTREENIELGANSLSEEFKLNRHAGLLSGAPSTEPGATSTSVDVEPIEAAPGSGFVPLDPDATAGESQPSGAEASTEGQGEAAGEVQQEVSAEGDDNTSTPETKPETDVESVTPEVPHLVDSTPTGQSNPVQQAATTATTAATAAGATAAAAAIAAFTQKTQEVAGSSVSAPTTEAKFHEQAPSPDDPEIRRQAAEIIRSLDIGSSSDQKPVSEAPEIAPTIQNETSAIEETIQRSFKNQAPQVIEVEATTPPPVVMPDLGDIRSALQKAQEGQGYQERGSGQIPVQIANEDPVQQDQEVLQEIRDQSAMVAGTLDSNTETQQSTDGQADARTDDRDILEVNENQETVAAATTDETPLPAWSQQEPSQGEAARVDYQRLFDQLRNVKDNRSE